MENQHIEKFDPNQTPLEKEYSHCTFKNCNFEQQKIVDVYFENCTFEQCNFSLTKFFCILRDAKFKDCKMTGVDFTEVSNFALSLDFEKCFLNYASFVEVKMKATIFESCDLSDAYFDNANLEATKFKNCDLSRTSFFNTNLQKADFSTSRNFTINPNNCKLKKAIFSEADLRGLLAHLDIKILEFGQI